MGTPGSWTPPNSGHTDEHNRLYNEGVFHSDSATPSVLPGKLLKVVGTDPVTVEGTEPITAEPIVVAVTHPSDDVILLDWTPKWSGWVDIDGPIFNWDDEWIDIAIMKASDFVDVPSVDPYGGPPVIKGDIWWHYVPWEQVDLLSEIFDWTWTGTGAPTDIANTTRETGSIYVEEGVHYKILIYTNGPSEWDISATLASIQEFGHADGFEHLGRIAPPQFPNLTYKKPMSQSDNVATSGGSASGAGNFSVGYYSSAFGLYNLVRGDRSFAAGSINVTTGSASTALGRGCHAQGMETIAGGFRSVAEGQWSVALGRETHAQGFGSFAINDSTHAPGFFASAFGQNTSAAGTNSIAAGGRSRSRWTGSFALASGSFTTEVGLAQSSRVVIFSQGNQRLSADGGLLTLPVDHVAAFEGIVTSRDPAGDNIKVWRIKGALSTYGTARIVGEVNKEIIAEDAGAESWDITVAANVGSTDNQRRALAITPSDLPLSSCTVATIDFTEIGS